MIRDRSSAIAEAMEGAAIAHTLARLHPALPFAEMRIISNSTGDRPRQHWDIPLAFRKLAELTAAIKRIGDFEVSVTAYPEKHPESPTVDADIDVLKAKVDAGATRAITQFFFDNDHYFRYLDRVRARGIDIPIIPGLIPIHNFTQVAGFTAKCGATIPAAVAQRFEGLDGDDETTKLMAATVAAEQVTELAARGVDTFHFYTLNRANLVYAICHLLGLRPAGQNEPKQEAA